MKRNKKYVLKGFTIMEMLISLVLTSMAISFSYTSLNYLQKLFNTNKKQADFISEYTSFKNRMDVESLNAVLIIENTESSFTIKRDTLTGNLQILDKTIVLTRGSHRDTFHISAKKVVREYEFIKNPAWTNKLIRSIKFETEYGKQIYKFSFFKEYESSVKLELEKENKPSWEQ